MYIARRSFCYRGEREQYNNLHSTSITGSVLCICCVVECVFKGFISHKVGSMCLCFFVCFYNYCNYFVFLCTITITELTSLSLHVVKKAITFESEV